MTGGTRTGSGRAVAIGPGGGGATGGGGAGGFGVSASGVTCGGITGAADVSGFTFVTAEMAVCRWGGCWMWISGIGMYGSSTLDRRTASSLGGGVFVRGGGSRLVSTMIFV